MVYMIASWGNPINARPNYPADMLPSQTLEWIDAHQKPWIRWISRWWIWGRLEGCFPDVCSCVCWLRRDFLFEVRACITWVNCTAKLENGKYSDQQSSSHCLVAIKPSRWEILANNMLLNTLTLPGKARRHVSPHHQWPKCKIVTPAATHNNVLVIPYMMLQHPTLHPVTNFIGVQQHTQYSFSRWIARSVASYETYRRAEDLLVFSPQGVFLMHFTSIQSLKAHGCSITICCDNQSFESKSTHH